MRASAVALLATGDLCWPEAYGQEAAPVELPAVDVVTTAPKQKKYPSPNVAQQRPAPTATPSAAPTATESTPTEPVSVAIPDVAVVGSVIGGGDRKSVLESEGSAHVVSGEQLYTSHVFTTNEALRSVPGIVVRDEEGFGIRPNIGIRGMNPTRSTKTLLLEDGLFLTYAPYGDNASYFHPSMDRFERIEVIKGAEQLLFGPQTISGTINYVTPNPPRKPGGFVALTGGSRDYHNGQLYYGGWSGNVGAQIDAVYKAGDGSRDNTEHEITDVGAKVIWQGSDQALIVKASAFQEDSQVSYSGITEAEAQNFGLRYNPFELDRFDTHRYAGSITHNWELTDTLSLASSVYGNTFDRRWWRQSSNSLDTQCGGTFRTRRLNGQVVNPSDPAECPSTQGRLREYYAYGLEQRVTWDHGVAAQIPGTLKVGYRVHAEEQDRRQINATSPTGRTGTLAELNERDAFAFSYYVQETLRFGPLSVTPAVRFEDISYERRNLLTGASGDADLFEAIPGISVNLVAAKGFNVFAGVHEGFAPPRVEDVITNAGGSVELDAESSTNYEVGFRSELLQGLKIDGTYFRNDFEKLIAVGSIAGGGQPLAQGEALFEGFELAVRADSQHLLRTPFNVYGQLAWTYLWDAEQVSAFVPVLPPIVVPPTAGNRQPYAPEHLVTARLGYAERNWDAHVELVYVGEQFADFLNLESPADHPDGPNSDNARSGQFGKIDDYTIVNVGLTYTIEKTNTDIYFAAKNIFDLDYIADKTRGILPGTPQLFHVGLKQNF